MLRNLNRENIDRNTVVFVLVIGILSVGIFNLSPLDLSDDDDFVYAYHWPHIHHMFEWGVEDDRTEVPENVSFERVNTIPQKVDQFLYGDADMTDTSVTGLESVKEELEAQDKELKILPYRFRSVPEVGFYSREGEFDSPSDLEGKTVGGMPDVWPTHAFLMILEEDYGIEQSDINLVETSLGQGPQVLEEGHVDVLYQGRHPGEDFDHLVDTHKHWGDDVPMYIVFITTEEKYDESLKALNIFMEASEDGLENYEQVLGERDISESELLMAQNYAEGVEDHQGIVHITESELELTQDILDTRFEDPIELENHVGDFVER